MTSDRYDNEATQLDNNPSASASASATTPPPFSGPKAKKSAGKPADSLKQAALGAASGLLVGALATTLMGMKLPDNPDNPVKPDGNDNGAEHAWSDGNVAVASGVTDDMSFSEAFAAARAEVGPGGCFEWRGNVYGTYTADEWNNMTPDEQAAFGSHFNWNNIDTSSTGSDVAPTRPASATETTHPQDDTTGIDDDIEVVSVNKPGENRPADGSDGPEGRTQPEQEQNPPEQERPEQQQHTDDTDDDEVQIIGIVHDPEDGTNVGAVSINGENVILVDVDNDLEFDYMASDRNHDGELDASEIEDIRGQGITVQSLGGFTDPDTDPNAPIVTPDDPVVPVDPIEPGDDYDYLLTGDSYEG